MNIHCLVHSELPGDTLLPEWAALRGHAWHRTLVPRAARLPQPAEADCLVVLGGPMSAWEEQRFPWLRDEKRLIERFLRADRPVIGICLGAQLLAAVLGARTYAGPHQEIGWFAVESTAEFRASTLGTLLPERFETFLWHGDSFELPRGALRIGRSAAFENQGFVHGRALALQFHLEVRPAWVRALAERDGEQLIAADHVQPAGTILAKTYRLYRRSNALMDRLLTSWLASLAPTGP